MKYGVDCCGNALTAIAIATPITNNKYNQRDWHTTIC